MAGPAVGRCLMADATFPLMVFVDLETTGATGTLDRITEIGIVEVNEDGEVREWSSLVNPQVPIPAFIQNCWRQFKSDHLCQLNFDQGLKTGFVVPGCG